MNFYFNNYSNSFFFCIDEKLIDKKKLMKKLRIWLDHNLS